MFVAKMNLLFVVVEVAAEGSKSIGGRGLKFRRRRKQVKAEKVKGK